MTLTSEAALPDHGFLYLAWGDQRYFDEAVASCRSLRAVSPDAHVTLAVAGISAEQESQLATVFDRVVTGDLPELTEGARPRKSAIGFTYKVRTLRRRALYRHTFFVDTDIHFTADPSGLFGLLDHFDLVVGQAPADLTEIRDSSGEPIVGYTPYNTGVILFNREGTDTLFADWEQLQDEALSAGLDAAAPDQTTFAQALLRSSCRFYVLQTGWNARLPYPERLVGRVVVVHARASEIGGLLLEEAALRVNKTDAPRVWMPGLNEIVYQDMGLHRWLWLSARGFRYFLWRDAYRIARFGYRRVLKPLLRRS